MQIRVQFFAHSRDLAGCAEAVESVPDGTRVAELVEALLGRFPKLASLRSSLRVAVGVDYQEADYVLRDGDEVAILPPMQGG